tara:strand:+ start:2997 stop:5066 length:2070 start_codon:yes stop_codon:yes gene_type:complete
MAIGGSSIGVTQGSHRLADLAHLSSRQSGGSLVQGQKKIRSWSDKKNSDMGAVAPLQYYRVPGDPDRSLHARKGSWLRLLGSGLSDGTLNNPLGSESSGAGVLGGDFSLISGVGVERHERSLFSWPEQTLYDPSRTLAITNEEKAQSYMKANPGSDGIEGFSNLDSGSNPAFNYDGKLGSLQDAYMGKVDHTLNETEPALRDEYNKAYSALKEHQEEYVKKSLSSRDYRNKIVSADGTLGYVTKMGGFRGIDGYEGDGAYRRGCPVIAGAPINVEMSQLHSYGSDENPLGKGGSCPPSGSNVQIMGATDPELNVGKWAEKCFDPNDINATFPAQDDLTGEGYADVANNCWTRAADLGSAAYSVSKTQSGSDSGEWMCRIGKNGASWDELTANNTPSTIERIQEIETVSNVNQPVLKVTSDGVIKLFEGETDSSFPLKKVSLLEPYPDCDVNYGAPISLESATLGGACNGKGPESLNPAFTLAKQTIDYAANISGLFATDVEDESPQEEVVVEQISEFEPVLADPTALPVLDDPSESPQAPTLCTGSHPIEIDGIGGKKACCSELRSSANPTNIGQCVAGWGDPGVVCNPYLDESAMYPWNMMGGGEIPKCGVASAPSLCTGSHPIEIDGVGGKKVCCSKLRSDDGISNLGQCVAGWGDPGVACNPHDDPLTYPGNMFFGAKMTKCTFDA